MKIPGGGGLPAMDWVSPWIWAHLGILGPWLGGMSIGVMCDWNDELASRRRDALFRGGGPLDDGPGDLELQKQPQDSATDGCPGGELRTAGDGGLGSDDSSARKAAESSSA